MSSPADIIYALLDDLDIPQSGNWAMFVGFLPDAPDNAICIYDADGRMDGRIMSSGERIIHPGVLIMVRSLDYREGWDKAETIALLLDEQQKVSVAVESDGTYILDCVSRTSPVVSVGMEQINDRRRNGFTINMTITVTRQA